MQFMSWFSVVPLAVLTLNLTGCNSTDAPVTQQELTQLPPSYDLTVATSTECPQGGSAIVKYQDMNLSGVFDAGDTLLGRTPVCNGAAGADGAMGAQGVGAGISVAAAAVSACPAGGTVIMTFRDLNNNGAQDEGEATTSLSTVCNGLAGANGADGADGAVGATGAAGESAQLVATAATSAQCPTGGVVYASSVGNAAPTQTVICNGANGSDGAAGATGATGASGAAGADGADGSNAVFEMGAVGPAVAGKSYSACHHDYLYMPGSGGARGWLVFRHQGNGANDQGIGSTGFQVWNVDISDFLLISEVGNVTYCTLHWDPNTLQLSYTVNDGSDGLAGQSGTLQL
jgi:hypothetical protein